VGHREAPSGDQLKVQIISSFGVPGSAPFSIGEELDVAKGIAKVWIDAGRAVSLEAGPVDLSEKPDAQTAVNNRETAVGKPKHKATR
jgi:hypothetical protein